MLKRLLVTLLAVVLVIPVTGLQVHADELSEEVQIQEVNEEVNNQITTDDSYNVEIVEEVVEENQEEVVIDNDAQVEVEQELEQEITTDEVIQEETTEEVKEVTTDVVDETLVEEQVEEEVKEEEPAPLMLMAAPKMAMLGATKEAEHNIRTTDYPITFTFYWSEIQRGKAVCNTSYSFDGSKWVQYETYAWKQNAYGWYKLDNSGSENNVYVTMTYTPVVEGSKLKLFKEVGETDAGIDPSFSSWTVAKAESQTYAGRYKSRMRNCDNDNQKWTFGMSGWGRQRIWSAGGKGTAVTKVVDESDRDGICTFSGYWGVICERSNGDLIIDTDDLEIGGGILGTVNLRIEINHDWFYEFLN